MATQTTAVSTAPATRPQYFYDKVLLETLRLTDFGHEKFAQVKHIAPGNGRTANFRKMGTLAPALTPLTEGVTPTGNSVSKTNITASVEQYGDFIEYSDRINFEEIDPILASYVREQGFQGKETMDIIIRDILAAGTNVYYANSKTDRATLAAGDKFTIRDARRIVRDFKKNHVKPVAGMDYACFISPDTEFDIIDDPDFTKIVNYGQNAQPLLDNEIGRAFNVRYFTLTNAKVFEGAGTAGADVHGAIFLGRNAYGTVDISGQGNVQSITKGLGSSGTSDPLNQRQTTGWKLNAFGAVRLEELALARYEHVPSV